jgi:hypothetical protein
VEYSIRRLKPLLILLRFCGATGSRALSKLFLAARLEAVPFPGRIKIKVKIKSKVKGDGQECSSHIKQA